MSYLDWFRKGLDTVEIAKMFGVTEAEASRRIFEERCIAKGRTIRPKIRSRSLLMKILDVNIHSGEIRWRAREGSPGNDIWNRKYAGKIAGGSNSQGYWVVNISGTHHRAHHIVWTISKGSWPVLDIDHIDGDRSNNSISNLREVSRSENLRNRGVTEHSRLGLVGVARSGNQWDARIGDDGKSVRLGRFSCFGQALAARHLAEKELGYDPNHGRRLAYGIR